MFRLRPLPVNRPLLTSLLSLMLSGAPFLPTVQAQTSVLTQNNDNSRTGANLSETTLTPDSVNVGHFGKLFTINALEANVNGQVLYLAGLSIAGRMHNVVFAYTSNNADQSPCGLWAFDADSGATLWHLPFPNSATYTTATPVIDPAAKIIYVLTKSDNDATGRTYLHAVDITIGTEKNGSPVQVAASVPGTGDGNVNGVVSFDGPASSGTFKANDRAGLLLLNGVVYTAFAHNSDSYPYHGWVIGYTYDGTKLTQTAKFCTTPNGGDGGVWMAGKGLTADSAGFLYFSVGNGTFDASTGGKDYSMCYVKLRASDLSVADYFAPFDEQGQSNQDLDLGNSGMVGIPGTNRLFGGATKFGAGFLLDSSKMGGFTPKGPDQVVLRLNGLTGNDSVGQNPIAWDASPTVKYVYLWANGANLEQFRYVAGAGVPDTTGTFDSLPIYKQTSGLTSGGSLAISSNGGSGAILWTVSGNAVVSALDATDVTQTPFWTSAQNSARDSLGSVGHFQFPTVVNGKVYVPTNAHSIVLYGLLTPAAPAPPTNVAAAAGNKTVTLSWTPSAGAASYNVYRGTSAGAEAATPLQTGITTATYTDTGLTGGTTYYYTVAAVNTGGLSGPSAEVHATPALPSISGIVSLQSVAVGNLGQPIVFTLTPTGTTAGSVTTQTLTLAAADGAFTLPNITPGTYTLGVKGSKWLRTDVAVDTTAASVTGLNVALLGGDINGDNVVSGADYLLLLKAYGSTPAAAKWNPNADLNCDGRVSGADYLILLGNYGKHGAP